VRSIEALPRDVAQIISATFPGYRRKKVWINATDEVSIHNLNWDGGSRNEYVACTLEGRRLGDLNAYHALAPWDRRQIHGERVPIAPGCCIVQGGTFCGKPSMLTIYVRPDDMPRALPAQ
jgi:hypothetical protein